MKLRRRFFDYCCGCLALLLLWTPHASAKNLHTKINLICKANFGTFARFTLKPGDSREIVVRRGKEMGSSYGVEGRSTAAKVSGHAVNIIDVTEIVPPPCMFAGPQKAGDKGQLKPTYSLIRLSDAEILIPRKPDGFSEAEMHKILNAIVIK